MTKDIGIRLKPIFRIIQTRYSAIAYVTNVLKNIIRSLIFTMNNIVQGQCPQFSSFEQSPDHFLPDSPDITLNNIHPFQNNID